MLKGESAREPDQESWPKDTETEPEPPHPLENSYHHHHQQQQPPEQEEESLARSDDNTVRSAEPIGDASDRRLGVVGSSEAGGRPEGGAGVNGRSRPPADAPGMVTNGGSLEFESWVVEGEHEGDAVLHFDEEPVSDVRGEAPISTEAPSAQESETLPKRVSPPPVRQPTKAHQVRGPTEDAEVASAAQGSGRRRRRRHRLRSVETQTEAPAATFPLRRAESEWTVVDRASRSATIRSERIRRAAQMFEDLAEAERQATLSWSPRRFEPRPVEVVPAAQWTTSQSVDAIVALPPQPSTAEPDSDGDEENEELLWLKVKAKIAERRRKFRELDSGTADRAEKGEIQPARQPLAPTPSGHQVSAPLQLEPNTNHLQPEAEHDNTFKCWTGKYIEQNQEQEVLRGLGNRVLAEQKLAARQKARGRLVSELTAAEQRCHLLEGQLEDTHTKLNVVKSKLTRDGAFERKRLEAVLFRLEVSLKQEQQSLSASQQRLQQTDTEIRQLTQRIHHLAAAGATTGSPVPPPE